MKKEFIAESRHQGKLVAVQILPSSAKAKEWLLLFEENSGHSYFLISDENKVQVFQTVEDALNMLSELEFYRAEIVF